MKRLILALSTAVAIIGLTGAQPVAATSTFAVDEAQHSSVTLAKDQVKNGAYYTAGETIVIDGTVNGDVYCAGQTVRINGTVNGDVICGAQRMDIDGKVSGDVRSAGQFITINGHIGGTLTSFSQTTTIAKNATVAGSVNGAGQIATINGTVGQDVVLGLQDLSINGQVKGDVHADVATMTLTGAQAVLGNVNYSSANDLSLDKSHVGGAINYSHSSRQKSEMSEAAGAFATFAVFMLIASVITAHALIALMPRYYERSFQLTRKRMLHVVLVGFAVLVGTPIATVGLMMTGILLPLALVLFAAYLLLCLLSFSFAAYYFGRWVFADVVRHSLLVMLAGAVIVAILLVIPIVNVFVWLAVHIIGMGGIVTTVINGYKSPSYTIPVK